MPNLTAPSEPTENPQWRMELFSGGRSRENLELPQEFVLEGTKTFTQEQGFNGNSPQEQLLKGTWNCPHGYVFEGAWNFTQDFALEGAWNFPQEVVLEGISKFS